MFDGCVVIPAAGLATRLKPLSNYIPKSFLPVVDRPIIIKHLERVTSLGASRIIIILEPYLGTIIETSIVRGFKNKCWIKFIYQHRDKGQGPGFAIGLAREYIGTSPFLVYLPDEWHTPELFSRELIQNTVRYYHHNVPRFDAIVAIAKFKPHDLAQIGNVKIDDQTELVTEYLDKPKNPISNWGSTGAWAFFQPQKFFNFLDQVQQQNPNQELHLGFVCHEMVNKNYRLGYLKERPNSFHIHLTDVKADRKSFQSP